MEAQKKEIVEAIKRYVYPEDVIPVKKYNEIEHEKCSRCLLYSLEEYVVMTCCYCDALICDSCIELYSIYYEDEDDELIFCNDDCQRAYDEAKKEKAS